MDIYLFIAFITLMTLHEWRLMKIEHKLKTDVENLGKAIQAVANLTLENIKVNDK